MHEGKPKVRSLKTFRNHRKLITNKFYINLKFELLFIFLHNCHFCWCNFVCIVVVFVCLCHSSSLPCWGSVEPDHSHCNHCWSAFWPSVISYNTGGSHWVPSPVSGWWCPIHSVAGEWRFKGRYEVSAVIEIAYTLLNIPLLWFWITCLNVFMVSKHILRFPKPWNSPTIPRFDFKT